VPIEAQFAPIAAESYGASYIVAQDFDRDGYEDILLISPATKKPNRPMLLKNFEGKRFVDVTESSGLGQHLVETIFASGIFFDLDNDGREELALFSIKSPPKFFRYTKSGFVPLALELNGVEGSDARALAVLDYDGDSYLDIVVGNYSQKNSAGPESVVMAENGAKDFLLRNLAGKGFSEESVSAGLQDYGYTQALGVSDIDGNGLPDLFVANDFGKNFIYLNQGKGKFVSAPKAFLEGDRSKFNMSAEFGDVNNDGFSDLYVSNMSKPNLKRGFNSLFMGVPTEQGWQGVSQAALERGVDKCGWSWGAKFADLNSDGLLDLVVSSGFYGKNPNSKAWFSYMSWLNVPDFVKSTGLFRFNSFGAISIAAKQRLCFFLNQGESFVDVSESVDSGALSNARGLALADFNNDGQADFFSK
jgi:hypothetical protein